MNLDELLALWNDEAARADMTDEQLDELRTALQAHARELLEGDRTDDVLAELDELAATVEAVETMQQERTNAAAERDDRADEIASRIFGADDDPDPETVDDPAAEVDDPEPEVKTAPEVTDPDVDTIDAETDVEPIAANAARFTPRITRVAARRPAATAPRRSAASQGALVASANIGGGYSAGTPIESLEDLASAFEMAWRASDGYMGPRAQISVARGGGDPLSLYGEDRYLDSNARGNARKIAALASPQAITASGGACVPPAVDYTVPYIPGTQARPARDNALVRFGADRGGITTLPPPVLTDLDGAVSVWTMANDENPSNPTTKPCLTITCPDDDQSTVDSIVKCLKIGNFRSRFWGEQVAAWIDLAAVQHAREAERRLITAVGTASTQVTSGQVLGTSRDVLATLDRATAQLRNRHRTDPEFPFHFAAPDWLREQISSDFVRQMPAYQTADESMALADAKIAAWLAVRRLNVTWLLEGETGQDFGPQGDGPLTGWPSTVVTYLYPEGSHLFLDGGMFDFGIVRDSTLNSTNDFQIFGETLEGHHFHGVESYRLTMDTCPDGSASALIDINPCAVGS